MTQRHGCVGLIKNVSGVSSLLLSSKSLVASSWQLCCQRASCLVLPWIIASPQCIVGHLVRAMLLSSFVNTTLKFLSQDITRKCFHFYEIFLITEFMVCTPLFHFWALLSSIHRLWKWTNYGIMEFHILLHVGLLYISMHVNGVWV